MGDEPVAQIMEERVEERTGEEGAARRLDASEVNRLAQELDDASLSQRDVAWESDATASASEIGARPADATSLGTEGSSTAGAASVGSDPLESVEGEREAHVFPPDVSPGVEIGGSPEEQGVLRDEYTEG